MSIPDCEIDEPDDRATCFKCFFAHAPCDCEEYEEEEKDEHDY